MKQNKIIDNIVKASIPIILNDFCGSGILSGIGQLSSQSIQLHAVVVFCNLKHLTLAYNI